MKCYTKIILCLLAICGLSGCITQKTPYWAKPMPWIFKQMPENSDTTFKKGWVDGCESGLASMTNSFFNKFYRFRQDAALRSDPTYYKVWKDTFTFCRHYAYGVIREGDMRRSLPNKPWLKYIGSEGILYRGILASGPGSQGMLFENFGKVGGDPYLNNTGVLNSMDFRDDYANFGVGKMEWDFRPKQDIGFWGDTTIDRPMVEKPMIQLPTLKH